MPAAKSPLSPFGQQLRFLRRQRGLSQLQLAVQAQTTPRHVSFIETGRSRPRRELVLRLAASMQLEIRDRNQLLMSAGMRPAFAEHDLDEDEMRPFRMAVEAILKRHEPYPGCAIDALGQVRMTNAGNRALFPGAETLTPEQALDAFFAPGPMREMVANWPEVAWAYADRLRNEAARRLDPRLSALAAQALAHLERVERPATTPDGGAPVMCLELRVGDQLIRTFTTVMRFDTALEVTTSELRVELVFPMDEAGDAFFRALVAAD